MNISGGSMISDISGEVKDDIMSNVKWASEYKASKTAWEDQKYMHMNKYQIMMEDLKKAGLNPILAAGGLSGGTPSRSLSSQGHQRGTKQGAAYSQASSAAQVAKSQADLNKIKEKTEGRVQSNLQASSYNLRALEGKAKAETLLAGEMALRQKAEAGVASAHQAKLTQDAIAQFILNIKRGRHSWLYKNKYIGRGLSIIDYLGGKIPFVVPQDILPNR